MHSTDPLVRPVVRVFDPIGENAASSNAFPQPILHNDENRENPPTLETVKEAIASGLSARLVGDGVLEEDEDDALLAEIEALIRRYGADSLAEDFLRYE